MCHKDNKIHKELICKRKFLVQLCVFVPLWQKKLIKMIFKFQYLYVHNKL